MEFAAEFPDFFPTGKTATATGAGCGIASYSAPGIAKYGADVVVTGRTVSQIEETDSGIRMKGSRSLAVPLDVTRPEDIRSGVDQGSGTRMGSSQHPC